MKGFVVILISKLYIERFGDYLLYAPVHTGVNTGVHQTSF